MKPVRTKHTNQVFKLSGGTEENDLPVERVINRDGSITLRSTWVLNEYERQAIADGGNIDLVVWGAGHPPVELNTTIDI